ncbi:hypothetical protein PsorP6_013406 [Peronosclerospora sorghi]|uniref:Uncharacterized protein n=1 Tax=Peronosclerospora sorghi TaxID=230839 RepID=A0ACC0VIL3_9STRA|nr:hypothetical protein PsorP6_013406 [Peronosclerospora sorghi]
MDPSNHTRRSPPQPVMHIIEDTLKSYRSLTAKIKSKQSALDRLEQVPPRSVKTNIFLSVSRELDEAGKADPLRNKFAEKIADNEAKLTAIIKESTKHELELLKTKLDGLYDAVVEEISSFTAKCIHRSSHQEYRGKKHSHRPTGYTQWH